MESSTRSKSPELRLEDGVPLPSGGAPVGRGCGCSVDRPLYLWLEKPAGAAELAAAGRPNSLDGARGHCSWVAAVLSHPHILCVLDPHSSSLLVGNLSEGPAAG